ncbi:MAG: nodulation protein NfeD [Bacteroidales bacterium]|nr:nodulation protein NfeD [Bacteroidales bacterium]MCF8403433.1 nodulation protein NfeD [Bacteroidales bacterium]
MKKQTTKLYNLISLTLLLLSLSGFSNDTTLLIYKFDIKEQIAPPVQKKAHDAFEEARKLKADLILIHMNTYGGMLDAADSIRTMILKSDIPVYVFIDNNAASAGALISIACDSIYMTSGANIGAATVVDQSGKPLPDKYQSYMRSMMRSTAESKGRDPDIAQAMVDPRIYIAGIIDTGQVLTFTAKEALEFNFCEGIAESVDEMLEVAKITDYEMVVQEFSPIDKIIHMLINPFVSGILIMIIIGGIYFELQSPGIGFPIAASIVAALLYFAPLYLEGLAEHWEILLFMIGVVFIAIEIFVAPGFGVPGILGIVFILSGLTLSMTGNTGLDFSGVAVTTIVQAFFIVVIAMLFSIVFSIYFSKKLFTSTIFGHLALDSVQKQEDGYTSSDKGYKAMLGLEGVAHTVLRPAGKVIIGDEIFDATAEAGFIDKGSGVKVTRYQNAQLFVIKM